MSTDPTAPAFFPTGSDIGQAIVVDVGQPRAIGAARGIVNRVSDPGNVAGRRSFASRKQGRRGCEPQNREPTEPTARSRHSRGAPGSDWVVRCDYVKTAVAV